MGALFISSQTHPRDQWDRVLLATSIQTKHGCRLLLGETEYESQIGVTEIGLMFDRLVSKEQQYLFPVSAYIQKFQRTHLF